MAKVIVDYSKQPYLNCLTDKDRLYQAKKAQAEEDLGAFKIEELTKAGKIVWSGYPDLKIATYETEHGSYCLKFKRTENDPMWDWEVVVLDKEKKSILIRSLLSKNYLN